MPWLFALGVLLIGFGGGLFSHGTLTATMKLAPPSQVGLALGAWGAVQATAAGVAVATGGVMRDLFSAAVAADDLLERVVRRSGALLQADAVFSIVALLFIYKSSTDGLATVLLLNRWSFGLAVAACVLLLTNLGLSWARKVGETYADPREAFSFTMDSYRRRAWRFTVSLWLSIAAFVLMLVAVWQLP
jgi:hypothetical protein